LSHTDDTLYTYIYMKYIYMKYIYLYIYRMYIVYTGFKVVKHRRYASYIYIHDMYLFICIFSESCHKQTCILGSKLSHTQGTLLIYVHIIYIYIHIYIHIVCILCMQGSKLSNTDDTLHIYIYMILYISVYIYVAKDVPNRHVYCVYRVQSCHTQTIRSIYVYK